MSEKFKTVKILSFVAVVMAIIVILSAIITPNGTNVGIGKYEKSKIWAMEEKENSIDIFFLGDSEVFSAISPLELWRKYGYAAYDCSSGQVKSYECYDLLETMLTKQKPKIVFVEANFLYRNYDEADIVYNKISQKLPLFKYHDVWKSYLDPDHEYESIDNPGFKGYRYYNEVRGTKKIDYMMPTDSVWEIDSISRNYFDKIYKLCEENDIQVVLLSSPSLINWNYKKHNGTSQLADKYGIDYIDMNLIDEIGIDWKKDTRDKGDHVNHSGAVKVTNYLGEYLKQKGGFKDHRNDPEYSDWNDILKKYNDKTAKKDKK